MSNALLERREELRTVISELKEELSDVNQKIEQACIWGNWGCSGSLK